METQQRVRIKNASGLHARPCHALVSLALGSEADVRVRLDGREVNGKSILELMTLNASCGSELEIETSGPGAADLLQQWIDLIDRGFEE